jgi:hypothetical protein
MQEGAGAPCITRQPASGAWSSTRSISSGFSICSFFVQRAKSLAAPANPRLKRPFAKLTLCSTRVYVQTRFVLESLGLQ